MYTYSVLNKVLAGCVAQGRSLFGPPQGGDCCLANVRILRLACVLSMLRLAGCVSWSGTAADGTVTTHIIGYAKVKHPSVWSSGELPQVSDVTHMGISLAPEGFVLGYGNKTLVSFPPSDQGYLFIDVRSEEDLRRVIGILQQEQLKEYPLCLAINAIGSYRGPSVAP